VDVGRDLVFFGGREPHRHHADEADDVGDAELGDGEVAAARAGVVTRERVAAAA
jgi:hypothetical protein